MKFIQIGIILGKFIQAKNKLLKLSAFKWFDLNDFTSNLNMNVRRQWRNSKKFGGKSCLSKKNSLKSKGSQQILLKIAQIIWDFGISGVFELVNHLQNYATVHRT